MKKNTSLLIGAVLFAIAACFIGYAANHPEAAFPWSNRMTFMFYGAYIWLLFRFLVDIPFLRKTRKNLSGGSLGRALRYFLMTVIFFAMETTGSKVDIYTILRGMIVLAGLDLGIENLWVWVKHRRSDSPNT